MVLGFLHRWPLQSESIEAERPRVVSPPGNRAQTRWVFRPGDAHPRKKSSNDNVNNDKLGLEFVQASGLRSRMEMIDNFLDQACICTNDFALTVNAPNFRAQFFCPTPVLTSPATSPAHPYALPLWSPPCSARRRVSIYPWKGKPKGADCRWPVRPKGTLLPPGASGRLLLEAASK